MSDSPLSCDFPETNIEQELEKRLYRTHGERLASPPARKVAAVTDSSKDMGYGVAHIDERFIDIRTAFSIFRWAQPGIINLFMIVVLGIMWLVGQFYEGVFSATAALFVPLWAAIYVFEFFFPLTLPVRIDRKDRVVYVAHRGTFYRIPWDELEVSFSYNLQYLGSGVVWERQYYSHIYLREKHFFCGSPPKRSLQRKKITTSFNEEKIYERWNFIVRYLYDGPDSEDWKNLELLNFKSYLKVLNKKKSRAGMLVVDFLSVVLLAPPIIFWSFAPFKFKWPAEIENIFGRANYY
ncbi:DUF6708 domain-containing protein [Methylophaga sp.]|uniref:DUF6708 domain-containing protein n=1 Tax=Methylophaga sp. TaxID=2024840 RepID=UPI003A91F9B3